MFLFIEVDGFGIELSCEESINAISTCEFGKSAEKVGKRLPGNSEIKKQRNDSLTLSVSVSDNLDSKEDVSACSEV